MKSVRNQSVQPLLWARLDCFIFKKILYIRWSSLLAPEFGTIATISAQKPDAPSCLSAEQVRFLDIRCIIRFYKLFTALRLKSTKAVVCNFLDIGQHLAKQWLENSWL